MIALGVALTSAIGALDYFTGYELSFSVFYLLPIVLVTWRSRRAGYVFCAIAAVVWLVVDLASGHSYSDELIPVWNACTRFVFFIVTSYLLGELRTHLKREQTLARMDGLTGTLNSLAFSNVSQSLLELAVRHQRPAAVGYVDIDDLKAINDSSGHAEGDRVLRAVAAILARCVRAADAVGRVGGDEFAVLLPETDAAGARRVFERIRREVAQNGAGEGRAVGLSIGVAVFPTAPSSIGEALKIADGLMYRVKSSGKNNVVYEERPKTDDRFA